MRLQRVWGESEKKQESFWTWIFEYRKLISFEKLIYSLPQSAPAEQTNEAVWIRANLNVRKRKSPYYKKVLLDGAFERATISSRTPRSELSQQAFSSTGKWLRGPNMPFRKLVKIHKN